MNTTASRTRSPLQYFSLVFALSLPFWLVGALTEKQLLPGVPVAALMFVCPVIAATILVFREDKTAGVAALLKRAFDFQRIKARIWYAPMILLAPCLAVLQYALLRWMGTTLPIPRFPLVATLVLSLALFIAALCEELGWSGYIIDPMQDRWGALSASIVLGAVWAVWHIVPLMQAHRSAGWIAWWCLATVAARLLIVWLYNNTGKSVFAASVLHATTNLCWQLFPIHGSYFDQRINAVITASAAAAVVILWGSRNPPSPREL